MVTAIEFKNSTKYFGKRRILDNINFKIKKGEIFGLVGMSGSGKTTLLNLLIGFYQLDDGQILYRPSYLLDDQQKDLRDIHQNLKEVRQGFGFAPQEPSFYPKLTIKENLFHFGGLYRLKKEAINKNTQHLLGLTQLKDHQDKLADQLSGGMQRRLSISCGLVHNPKVLLLDEPTADLDPILRKETWQLVENINKQGTTVIIASHFLEELEDICDRIAILHNGRILQTGKLSKIKDNFAHNNYEISIELKKTNKKLLRGLSKKDFSKIEYEDSNIIIYTQKPFQTLKKLNKILKKNQDNIINVSLEKPTLKEIFKKLMKKR